MEVFQPLAEADFLDRVVGHLLKHHSDVIVDFPDYACLVEELPRNVLQEMVVVGVTRARSYGMEWESTLCSFVVLMFVAAPNFDEHPLIRRVLKDESVPPDSRVNMLWRRVSDETWEAAEENYDAQAWTIRLRKNPDGTVIHTASSVTLPPAADSSDVDETPICPECGEDVLVGVDVSIGAVINCEECGAGLRVAELRPIDLESVYDDKLEHVKDFEDDE
jgi:transcription elongation factor Elf1